MRRRAGSRSSFPLHATRSCAAVTAVGSRISSSCGSWTLDRRLIGGRTSQLLITSFVLCDVGRRLPVSYRGGRDALEGLHATQGPVTTACMDRVERQSGLRQRSPAASPVTRATPNFAFSRRGRRGTRPLGPNRSPPACEASPCRISREPAVEVVVHARLSCLTEQPCCNAGLGPAVIVRGAVLGQDRPAASRSTQS